MSEGYFHFGQIPGESLWLIWAAPSFSNFSVVTIMNAEGNLAVK